LFERSFQACVAQPAASKGDMGGRPRRQRLQQQGTLPPLYRQKASLNTTTSTPTTALHAVTSCAPQLPNLPALSQLLRQENRFAEFVKGARQGFAALVQREIEEEEARHEAAGARRASVARAM
jgi:hypothetical protein